MSKAFETERRKREKKSAITNHQSAIIYRLHEIGAIQFGTFTLKSGITSPIYIDLRMIISYPNLLKALSEAVWETVSYRKFDLICGVPYTALPIATYLSLTYGKPMIMRRKEVKNYGTKKVIEGVFHHKQTCLVIEDLITSGSSVFETIAPIEEGGVCVRDIVVFLDREQGGQQKISEKGYTLHSVFTLTEVLNLLEKVKRISKKQKKDTLEFIETNRFL